jgi:hypothetical protein
MLKIFRNGAEHGASLKKRFDVRHGGALSVIGARESTPQAMRQWRVTVQGLRSDWKFIDVWGRNTRVVSGNRQAGAALTGVVGNTAPECIFNLPVGAVSGWRLTQNIDHFLAIKALTGAGQGGQQHF